MDADEPLSLRERFDSNYADAKAGDPASMYNVYKAASGCFPVGGMQSKEDLHDHAARLESVSGPSKVVAAIVGRLEPILEDCIYINQHKPDGFWTYGLWVSYWLKKSAAAGNPLAMLELRFRGDIRSQDFEETAEILERAVATGDYRAFYAASTFYANYFQPRGSDFNQPKAIKWNYIGCDYDPACDEAALLEHLERRITPSRIAIILEAAAELPAHLKRGEPFGFKNGWLPYDMDLNP